MHRGEFRYSLYATCCATSECCQDKCVLSNPTRLELLFSSHQESDASQKCLDAYNYDKSMCSAYFQAYKNCRKYWVSVHFQ